jgi:hypothetical protein
VIAGSGLFAPAPTAIVFGPDGVMLKLITAPPVDAFAAMMAARSVHDDVHELAVSSVEVTVKTVAALAGSANIDTGTSCSARMTAPHRATLAVVPLSTETLYRTATPQRRNSAPFQVTISDPTVPTHGLPDRLTDVPDNRRR